MGMRHTVDRASTLSPTLSLQFSFHTSWNPNTCFFPNTPDTPNDVPEASQHWFLPPTRAW